MCWRKSQEKIKTHLIIMLQTQRRTSPNSPRHYYGKMDNPLSTTILPWVAVLRDKLYSMSGDMEELSAPCIAPSKQRISALSSSFLLLMKLSPSFCCSCLNRNTSYLAKLKEKACCPQPLFPHYSSPKLQSNISSSRDRLNVRAHSNSSPGSLGAVSGCKEGRGFITVEKYGKTTGKIVNRAKKAQAHETIP